MQDFRKLDVWHRAHALSLRVDVIVTRFPRRPAGLAGQLSRAAASIATNISEGSAADSQREFARYLDIAIRSTSETLNHLLKARDGGLHPARALDECADETVQIRRMVYGLRRRILEDLDGEDNPPTD